MQRCVALYVSRPFSRARAATRRASPSAQLACGLGCERSRCPVVPGRHGDPLFPATPCRRGEARDRPRQTSCAFRPSRMASRRRRDRIADACTIGMMHSLRPLARVRFLQRSRSSAARRHSRLPLERVTRATLRDGDTHGLAVMDYSCVCEIQRSERPAPLLEAMP